MTPILKKSDYTEPQDSANETHSGYRYNRCNHFDIGVISF